MFVYVARLRDINVPPKNNNERQGGRNASIVGLQAYANRDDQRSGDCGLIDELFWIYKYW
jgi:hypothetical protein